MAWLFAFSIVWTAVASSAITTIVLRRRTANQLRVGELTPSPWPVPSWVPQAEELKHRSWQMPVAMPAAANAVTIRVAVDEVSADSWERDETTPNRPSVAYASSRLPTVPAA
jgi:hypothetical protein